MALSSVFEKPFFKKKNSQKKPPEKGAFLYFT